MNIYILVKSIFEIIILIKAHIIENTILGETSNICLKMEYLLSLPEMLAVIM